MLDRLAELGVVVQVDVAKPVVGLDWTCQFQSCPFCFFSLFGLDAKFRRLTQC